MAAILIRLTKRPDRAVDQALSLLSLFTAMDNPLPRGVVFSCVDPQQGCIQYIVCKVYGLGRPSLDSSGQTPGWRMAAAMSSQQYSPLHGGKESL